MRCESCRESLEAEIRKKDQENLTSDERAILQGEEIPRAYGPLSPVDVAYCRFCHTIGQIGSVLIASIVGIGIGLESSIGIGLLIGLVLWLSLAIVVGYLGRFPLLGPTLGPSVEWFFAEQFEIYLTEKSERQYGIQSNAKIKTDPDDGTEYELIENRVPMEGPEMHLVATPAGIENCMDMNEFGALMLVQVENDSIVDYYWFDRHYNRFENINDHVGLGQYQNVCDAEREREGPVSYLQFSEFINTHGERGLETL